MPFPPIIYQDDAYIVINKPAGLVVQMSHTHQEETLEEMLPDTEGIERRGLVHRLDRYTSGVMVVAKTAPAQQDLQAKFKQRQVEKTYTILVWGEVPDEHAFIEAPIARHPVHGHKFVVTDEGRDAKTEFWKEAVYTLGTEKVTLLRVGLHTGRTHQIRVHFTALGYPVVGDTVYGRRKDPGTVRQCVHARTVGFAHPVTQEPVAYEAPLASDIVDFIALLKPIV